MELNKEAVKEWCLQTTGEFHYKAALDGQYVKSKTTYDRLRKAILELKSEKVIVQAHNKKDGFYRLADVADQELMWWLGEDIDDSKVNLLLPFGLHKAVYIPRPALVTVSGDTNAGKTALANYMLNVNQDRFDECKLLMTEGFELLKDRMRHAHPLCPMPPLFKAFKKSSHFEDDVLPNGLTVIDYLRPPNAESLMSIGAPLEAITSRLDTGIAIVCMQKPRGERKEAFGGIVTEWDAALAMSVHSTSERFVSYLKLNKIKKSLISDRDLYKLKIRFRINYGIQLQELEKVYE